MSTPSSTPGRSGRAIVAALLLGLPILVLAARAPAAQAHAPAAAAPAAGPPVGSLVEQRPTAPSAYRGLVQVTSGACRGLYRVKGTSLCTHGPDPVPRRIGPGPVTVPDLPAVDEPPARARCVGDGASGARVEVIYARAADQPDRYDDVVGDLRDAALLADRIYDESAQETGGSRRIRFVHGAGCLLVVRDVVLDPSGADSDGGADGRGDDDYATTVAELARRGFDLASRKYMVFVDAEMPGVCGYGSVRVDDSPGPANDNEQGESYGVTYADCWDNGGRTPAHELMHNLGGVQHSAPHATGGFHCLDEYDRMCARDSENAPELEYLCPAPAHEARFDCNHDDYYSTRRPAIGYLAGHWNTALSRFLVDQPECDDLRARRAGNEAQIEFLQEQLGSASPAQKPDIIDEIERLGAEQATLSARLAQIGCKP